MRTETKYNKIVNFDEETKEITMLNYIFKHSDGFKGATGTRFEPVSRQEYDERTEEENVIEYLVDSGIELPDNFKRGGFQEMYYAMEANDKINDLIFDCSYSEMWDELREELNLSMDEAYIFTCTGGGRCFDKNFIGNVNTELSVLIREIES